jgi:precorrin-8X/cobalt-precorrin-8 methylmutase
MLEYVRSPREIYRRSFATIRAEADLGGLPPDMADVAVRIVHASGMVDILGELAWTPDFVAAAKGALEAGAPILTDTRMLAEGIMPRRLPAENPVICNLYEPEVIARAKEADITRAICAVDAWGERQGGALVAIGNAPTALFRLIERLKAGAPRPAAILAFPVGFVGAAESKQALVDHDLGVPYLTLLGRRGGSALAAAAVNAMGKHGE